MPCANFADFSAPTALREASIVVLRGGETAPQNNNRSFARCCAARETICTSR